MQIMEEKMSWESAQKALDAVQVPAYPDKRFQVLLTLRSRP